MYRPLNHLSQTAVIAAATLASVAGLAHAATPNLDFGVEDQPSYEVFCDAIRASEYVRYDYVNNPTPRVVGTVAALVTYASRNPLADDTQLTAFVNAYDGMLAAHAPGDPDLDRSSNLLAALHFSTLASDGALAGTTVEIGNEVVELLGIGVPEPDNYDSMKRRMVQFDRARIRSFSNASEWAKVLVIGFSGQDLNGAPNTHLAGALKSYIESQGFEAVPDGSPDDARFAEVDVALAGALPADYTAYAAMLAQPVETSLLWGSIQGAFADVAGRTDARIAEFQAEMAYEPTLIEGMANSNNQGIMDALVAEYRSRIDEVAAPRTIVAANAMFMLQSADPGVRNLAQQSLDFSGSQLETNNTMAGITSGVQYLGGVATLGVGIASGNPVDAIGGLTSAITGGLGLVNAFGGASPPSAEEQMFDEIVEMRDQLEDVRVEMNMRFNRIEDQLDVMYDSMADGFNALGAQIGDLTADVEDLTREMMIARAALERIEDALWGMSSDILDSYIAILANELLDYRDDNGVDLPYNGPTSFLEGLNGFFTVATFHARDTETFAGDLVSTLTVASASERLNGESIGRNLNDLRVFPAQLGLPVLWNSRVAAPAPWSQAASAYAQIARENPWYFAYKYERELAGGGTAPELDVIIDLGEDLTAAAVNGRSPALFDALFAGYNQAAADIGARIDTVRASTLANAGLSVIDPWGGITQEVQQYAPVFTQLIGALGLDNLPLPNGIGTDCWNIFGDSNIPELAAVILEADAHAAGGHATNTYTMTVRSNIDVSNGITVSFTHYVDGDFDGNHPELGNRVTRRFMVWEIFSSGDPVNINGDSNAIDIFDEDFFFWTQVRGALLTGENLEDQSIFVQNGNGENIRIDVTLDLTRGFAADPESYITERLDELQDEVWTAAATDGVIGGLSPLLPAYESLIEAYATLALPDMLEQSSAARACLRADPATGGLSMTFTEPVSDVLAGLVGDGDNGDFFDFAGEMTLRSSIAHNEIDAAIARPAAGQSFVDFTLAELNDTQDKTFRLAIDDTFAATGDATLSVDALSGLLANDVGQQFRDIMVDTAFIGSPGSVSPQNGTVMVNDDGSFTYTPHPGFVGTDRFTYRSFTDDPSWIAPVYSDPATVVILVGDGAPCPVDFDGNGLLDLADIVAFVTAFNANEPLADLAEPFGLYDLADVVEFVTAFTAGCP